MRRAVLALTALLLAAVPFAVRADDLPAGIEGCVVNGQVDNKPPAGGANFYKSECTYTAKRTGGWAGNGTWQVTIEYEDGRGGPFVLTNADPKKTGQGCTAWDPGAKVTAKLTGSGGIAVGNPFPTGAPSSPSAPCYPEGYQKPQG
jgi:hypothetical protein